MTYKRLTSTMVEIDGEVYIKHEFRGENLYDIKSSICALLRRNGEMTQGVLVNRCRKWRADDVRNTIKEMIDNLDINVRASVHPHTKAPVFYYSLHKK